MRAMGLLVVPALLSAAAFADPPPGIPDGWSDGYVYANGIRLHYYHAVPAPEKPVIAQYWALSKKQYHGPYTPEARQAMSGTMGTGNSLAEIRVPALILKADAPPEARQANEEAASVMQNGRLVHIDGAGHNLHHDELERTVEVLTEFLSEL